MGGKNLLFFFPFFFSFFFSKAECGLCSGDVLNNHKAVQCDKCEMWVHNDCSFVTDFQYETMQNSSCTWICPKCEFFNFSDSFFSEQLNLEDQNRFISLAKDSEIKTPSTVTKNNKFVSGLKFASINVNGIRGKKLELLAYLDFHQPQIVATQTRNVVLALEICLVAYPTFWLTQGNLEPAEVLRVYAALNSQEEQICLYLSSWLGILK